MDLPDFSITSCPIDFLCDYAAPVWSAWAFVAWFILMFLLGAAGSLHNRTVDKTPGR